MDFVLCDELIEEILQRVPSSYSSSVLLVSKRWLSLLRSSTTSLSLRTPSSTLSNNTNTHTTSLSTILSHYPSLSSLTVVSPNVEDINPVQSSSDTLLLAIASSPCARRLLHLRFLPDSPLSAATLLSSACSFTRLTSLQITSLFPLSFQWMSRFPFLKSFSLVNSCSKSPSPNQALDEPIDNGEFIVLPVETLSLSGIRASDRGLSWLWRRCGKLKWLQLRACDGTGDGPASAAFALCLPDLLGLELRTCRSIADRVLLLAADRCRTLASLLLYDGGGRDALHLFIHRRGAALRTLDLRLPLDLHNDHLLAIAGDAGDAGGDRSCLAALRLQSCCLVTGDGLRSLARAAAGAAIEELALVNCDVVEREPGLLTFLGQSMRRLRRIDLSYNETLADKEVGAMLASCQNLVEIRLRGCRRLTGASLMNLLKYCGKSLETVDITRCDGIGSDYIEIFVRDSSKLNCLIIEESKLSESANALVSKKGIKIC